tara:strand:- start:78953 stop:79699 length:747 start_codon:yes stop_codon:yes gene_type:complete
MDNQSRLARWGLRLAIAALVLLTLSILVLRFDLLAFRLPVLAIAAAGILGLVGLLVSLGGLIVTLSGKKSGISTALIGLVVAIVAATPFVWTIVTGGGVPPIHDISTDIANPPQFVAVLPLRSDTANPLDRTKPENLAELQSKAYPQLTPTRFDAQPGQVFDAARDVVRDMGWELVAATPETGLIEATATTRLLNFKDDVAIRVTEDEGGGTIVDLRSVSRVGQSDLGANAKRIEAFIAALKIKLSAS